MAIFIEKNTITSQDSRAFRRARSFCLIKYSLLSADPQKKIMVNARNISAGGTLFVSDTDLPKGTMLEMEIYLPPLKDFVTVLANVVEALKARDEDQYLVRVRFTAMDAEDRKRINFYIENLANNPFVSRYLDRKAAVFKRRFL